MWIGCLIKCVFSLCMYFISMRNNVSVSVLFFIFFPFFVMNEAKGYAFSASSLICNERWPASRKPDQRVWNLVECHLRNSSHQLEQLVRSDELPTTYGNFFFPSLILLSMCFPQSDVNISFLTMTLKVQPCDILIHGAVSVAFCWSQLSENIPLKIH